MSCTHIIFVRVQVAAQANANAKLAAEQSVLSSVSPLGSASANGDSALAGTVRGYGYVLELMEHS